MSIKPILFACLLLSITYHPGARPDIALVDSLIRTDTVVNQPPALSDSGPDTSAAIQTMPQLRRFVDAVYPDTLLNSGISGEVLLDLLVDSAGTVEQSSLVKSLHPALDSAAIKASLQFRFSPARMEDRPVAVMLRYAYRFSATAKPREGDERICLHGTVYEKGTKKRLSYATIALVFGELPVLRKKRTGFSSVDSMQNGIPLGAYLEQIGSIPGQQWRDGELVTQSDSLGQYRFKSLPCGTMGIRIAAEGHKVRDDIVVIVKDKITIRDFYLLAGDYNDYEIVVYGKQEAKEIARHEMTPQEIRSVPGFNGEVVKVLQAFPGISRSTVGYTANEINIREGGNDDGRIYYNGIEIPYLYHEATFDFNQYRSIFNSEILASSALYPGGVGVRHGNLLSGMIDLSSRSARTDRFHGIFDINFKGYSLALETPLTMQLSVIGSLRGSLFSYVNDLVIRHILHQRVESVQNNYDYSLRLDYAPNPQHRIFIESIGAKDTMRSEGASWMTGGREVDPSAEPNGVGRKFNQGIVGWNWIINNSLKNEMRAGIRKQWFTNRNSYENGSYALHGSEITGDFRDEVTRKFNENLTVCAGVDLHLTSYLANTISRWGGSSYADTQSAMLGHAGVYALSTWKPLSKLTLTPGFRYDYYPALKSRGSALPEFGNYPFDNTTPISGDPSVRVASRYELLPGRFITASAGTYSQCPDSMALMFKDCDPEKKDLLSKKGSQFTLGYEWRISDLISLDLEGYHNEQWDLFRYTTAQERMSATADTRWWKCDGKKRMTGLEVMLKRDQGRVFSGWLAYTLGYGQEYDFSDNKWALNDRNVLNNAQLVCQWALPWQNNLGLRLQYTEGFPYTPMHTQYYDATNFYYQAQAGEKNSKRYPPYLGLDLNYAKKWVFKKSIVTTYIDFIRLSHWLQLINDKDGKPLYYPAESWQYTYDFSSYEGIANIPMISFGAKWEF